MNKLFIILKKVFFVLLFTILILGVFGYVYLYVLPKGPEVTEVEKLKTGTDSFVMYAYKTNERRSIKVWTYKPENWKNNDRIIFVMHGGGRNADDYLDAWKNIAEEQNILVLAPEFANKFSKYTTNDYQEGNLFTFFGTRNPKEEWAYTVIENIFDHVKETNDITNKNYDLFGHSAGGQFVHRMILLMPEARINKAIAANAGFYTLPIEDLEYPYGLKNTQISFNTIQKSFEKQLIVFLGENDNDPSLGTFRETDLAMQQGEHRLARGSYFYKTAFNLAEKNSWNFNWKINTVEDVGHNYSEMSQQAVKYFEN